GRDAARYSDGDDWHTFRGSVSHHAGVQLSGGAGAGWDEATGRFADAGKCNRADDGSLGHAAATRGIELASGTFKNAASYHGRLFENHRFLSISPARARIRTGLRVTLGTGDTSFMAGVKKAKPDLTKKVHEVPHKPGVYLMRDRFNRVIYVGKARDLRKRVGSYFMPSKIAVADLKTRAMLDAVWDFETHTVQSEAESILLEGKLIKEYRPRYNVSFRDDKRFLLVKVDQTEDWPRFRLARFKKDDNARYFGPYAHAGALRQTLNFMRKKFGVLTFGRGSPTERELKSSTYQVPMKLSEITPEIYRERVAQACEFLE